MVERNKSFQIAANVIMILLSAMCIVPFILLIMSSITKENILLKYGYSFWPREISFDAYKTLLVDSGSIVRGYFRTGNGSRNRGKPDSDNTVCLSTVKKRASGKSIFLLCDFLYDVVQRWLGTVLYDVDWNLSY